MILDDNPTNDAILTLRRQEDNKCWSILREADMYRITLLWCGSLKIETWKSYGVGEVECVLVVLATGGIR